MCLYVYKYRIILTKIVTYLYIRIILLMYIKGSGLYVYFLKIRKYTLTVISKTVIYGLPIFCLYIRILM